MSDDRQAIRELIENWAIWRDAGDWARFATVWHDDGYMMATWLQGPATEFIRVSREGFERGVSILHFLGGTSVDLAGARAIAPAARVELDADKLGAFPAGYRHLAYVQAGLGFQVKRDMPGLTGRAVLNLYRRGGAWLAGEPLGEPPG